MKVYLKLLVVSLLPFAAPASAQVNSPDSLLNQSRVLAGQEQYESAIKLAQYLSRQYPEEVRYTIYLGQLYGWSKKYDSAVALLTPVVDHHPSNQEALRALINIYFWKEDFDNVAEFATRGLRLDKSDSSFYLLKLARAYHEKKEDYKAMKALQSLPQQDKQGSEALGLKALIAGSKKNTVTLSYLNTSFRGSGAASWHLMSVSYKRNTSVMPAEVRLNYGNMYQLSATQLEIDLYPAVTRKSYLCINAGVSEGKAIFPVFKGAVEYFTSPLQRLTISAGTRFLNFKPDPVWIFTAQANYDFDGWQPAYRYFLSLVNSANFSSHNISLRKTFELRESYIQLDVQYGNIPFSVFTASELNRVSAIRAGIQGRIRFGNSFFLSPAFMYEYEEYYPGLFRHRFNTQLLFSIRF